MIFSDDKFKWIFNFLDDVVIFTQNFVTRLDHLRKCLGRLAKAGLTANPGKIKLGCAEIPFIGYITDAKSVRINPSRTEAITNFPRPNRVKEIYIP